MEAIEKIIKPNLCTNQLVTQAAGTAINNQPEQPAAPQRAFSNKSVLVPWCRAQGLAVQTLDGIGRTCRVVPTASLEQSGKAEQKTQDDGAENVCAWAGMAAHLQPLHQPCDGAAVRGAVLHALMLS